MPQDTVPPLVSRVLGELLKVTGEGLALIRPRATGTRHDVVCALGSGERDILSSGTLLRAALRGVQFGLSAAGRPVLAAPVRPAEGPSMVIALWRGPGGKSWTSSDYLLATAIAAVVCPLLSAPDSSGTQATDLFDPLTRLPALGWFQDELNRRIERADRDQEVSTLMLVDIDHLQRLNDAAGRQEGDRILLRAAAGLRRVTRPSDLLARIGGDEFALWLTGMDHLAAAERAEYIRRDLLAPEPDDTISHRLTVTIGIATRWPGRSETVEALTARAEAAVLQVKAEGGAAWRVAADPAA